MKRLFTYLLLTASLLGFTIKAGADDRWETLRAINWVENPTNHTKIGRFGELGPYQFRPATWRMHTDKPFKMAAQREAADEVAVIHYEWIKKALLNAGVDASPFNIAMAWNSGVDNVLNGRSPAASYNYAERVTNLVHTFKRNSTSVAGPVAAVVKPAPKPVIGMVYFAVMQDAPRFEIVLPEPAPDPVVHTDRDLAEFSGSAPLFILSTTATLTPRFTLLPSLID